MSTSGWIPNSFSEPPFAQGSGRRIQEYWALLHHRQGWFTGGRFNPEVQTVLREIRRCAAVTWWPRGEIAASRFKLKSERFSVRKVEIETPETEYERNHHHCLVNATDEVSFAEGGKVYSYPAFEMHKEISIFSTVDWIAMDVLDFARPIGLHRSSKHDFVQRYARGTTLCLVLLCIHLLEGFLYVTPL